MSGRENGGLTPSDISWAWEAVSRQMLISAGIDAIGLIDWFVEPEIIYGLVFRDPEYVPFTMTRGGSLRSCRIWSNLADDIHEVAMRNVFSLMTDWHEGRETCPHRSLRRS